MSSTDLGRVKNRKAGGSFTSLPHHVFRSTRGAPPPVAALSKLARLLLVDIAQQLTGKNNGNLAAAPKILEPYGWRSRGTLDKALVELVALGFLVQTRQGGRNRCSLFGVTWRGIDPGPHDATPDPVPLRLWLPEKEHLRDESFLIRWRMKLSRTCPVNCPTTTDEKKASRVADKASRVADKSAKKEAA